MIHVNNAVKSFGATRALDGLCLTVPKGSVYGLVGANGAGKTTIINHLTGALKQDSGEITIDGTPVYENSAVKEKTLSIADDWFFYNTYSVKDMMLFYKSLYKGFDADRYKRLSDAFGISEKQMIRRLSKGMKKQVAFWLTLSCMPEVLILDEPLDGLDPVMRKQILTFLISDVSERGMTVLVSSHNLRELEDACDHIGIMHKGRMLAEKALDDLRGDLHKFQVAFTAGFPEVLRDRLDILHFSSLGAIHTLILRGDAAECEKIIQSHAPLLCEHVPLSLEEVFIYELGGMGYDIKNIIL